MAAAALVDKGLNNSEIGGIATALGLHLPA
jgi:hypothetical protein